jgi:hypothetical protein
VGVVFEIVDAAEHKRRSRLLADRWLAAKMLLAALEGNLGILKIILDRTEGKVQRTAPPPQSCRVELQFNIPQQLEAARERVLLREDWLN